jgi:hypothetical protein
MSRPALLICLACLLSPTGALADEPPPSPLDWFQRWIASLGQPRLPPSRPPEDTTAHNTVTLNPLALRQQRLGLEYERALGSHVSIYLAPQAAFGIVPDAWTLSAELDLGLRIFVLGTAPGGIFFGPELAGLYERSNENGLLRYGLGTGIGATVGWTLVFFEHFTLSVGFSSQYRTVPQLDAAEGVTLRKEFVSVPRLAFGVAF